MPTYYPDDPEKDKQAKSFLRTLKRRQSYLPAPIKVMAHGGPFAGHQIWLTWGTGNDTAVIRVGDQVGRYKYSKTVARWVPLLVEAGV